MISIIGLRLIVSIKTLFRPEQAQGVNETYELHFDNEVLQAQIKAEEIHVQQGQARTAEAAAG